MKYYIKYVDQSSITVIPKFNQDRTIVYQIVILPIQYEQVDDDCVFLAKHEAIRTMAEQMHEGWAGKWTIIDEHQLKRLMIEMTLKQT